MGSLKNIIRDLPFVILLATILVVDNLIHWFRKKKESKIETIFPKETKEVTVVNLQCSINNDLYWYSEDVLSDGYSREETYSICLEALKNSIKDWEGGRVEFLKEG